MEGSTHMVNSSTFEREIAQLWRRFGGPRGEFCHYTLQYLESRGIPHSAHPNAVALIGSLVCGEEPEPVWSEIGTHGLRAIGTMNHLGKLIGFSERFLFLDASHVGEKIGIASGFVRHLCPGTRQGCWAETVPIEAGASLRFWPSPDDTYPLRIEVVPPAESGIRHSMHYGVIRSELGKLQDFLRRTKEVTSTQRELARLRN